jgi:hypothetical protein
VAPIELFSLNAAASARNDQLREQLPMPEYIFRAVDSAVADAGVELGVDDEGELKDAAKAAAPETISLRVGSNVLLARKLNGVPAGSHGVVLAFENVDGDNRPTVRFALVDGVHDIVVVAVRFEVKVYGLGVAVRQQVPLREAGALTVHTAQGLGFDWLVCHFDPRMFCEHQAFTSLSRARRLSGLSIRGAGAGVSALDAVRSAQTIDTTMVEFLRAMYAVENDMGVATAEQLRGVLDDFQRNHSGWTHWTSGLRAAADGNADNRDVFTQWLRLCDSASTRMWARFRQDH